MRTKNQQHGSPTTQVRARSGKAKELDKREMAKKISTNLKRAERAASPTEGPKS